MACVEVSQLNAPRFDLITRAPIRTAQVRRRHALLQCVSTQDIGGRPESAGRVEPTESATVVAPRGPSSHCVAIHHHNVGLLGEFVSTSVPAVPGGQEQEVHVAGMLEVKGHLQRRVRELSEGPLVVGQLGGVEQGGNGMRRRPIAGQVTFHHVQPCRQGVSLGGPGVDVGAHPKRVGGGHPRLEGRQVGLPRGAVGPSGDRCRSVSVSAFGVAEVTHAKGGDEPHPFQGRHSVAFTNGSRKMRRVRVVAFEHAVEVVSSSLVGHGKEGAALVPRVAGRGNGDVETHVAPSRVVGHDNGLEKDASGIEAVGAVLELN